MKILKFGVVAAALAVTPTYMTIAGPIERACVKSDRKKATRYTCSCIQSVANSALSRKDQKLAAKFFKEPHMAQEIRQSDNRSHESFWKRYKKWGSIAERNCS